MNTLQTIPHQNLAAWEQQGRVVKQWLRRFTGHLDWLAAYALPQNLCLGWMDASHVTLRDMPLLGQCLADLAESSMHEQPGTEAGIKKRASSGDGFSDMGGFSDFKKHTRTRYKKQDRKKLQQSSVLRKSGLQAKYTQPAESISRVGRIPARADYTSLRRWGDTQSPDQSSNFEDFDFEAFDFEAFDREVSDHLLPGHMRRNRESAFSNNNAVRQTQPQFQKEWVVYALRRVNKMLNGRNENVHDRGVAGAIRKKHFRAIRRGFLLAEQWKSVIQDENISHEFLMKISAKTAPISSSEKINQRDDPTAALRGKPGRGTVIHKAPDTASFGSQRSNNRQQKSTRVTHEEKQSELEMLLPAVLQRESPVQSRQQQQQHLATSLPEPLKTAEEQATESLLETENNPVEIQQNDKQLAMQIKRILDEEARRYGIDI